jgi:acylphosphatase
MEKRKILIKGPKVHSVGYRAFLLDEAEALFIPNFSARNIKNETEIVEVLVGGTKEKIDIFIKFVENNYPDDAEVADISVEDYDGDIRTIEAYSRSFSASQLSKIAVSGVALLKNQKEHIGLTRKILDKQDEHISITKEILQKQDEHISISKEILQKQDEHISITKEGFNNILAKQEEHINITKEGFNSITHELKSFKDVHQEILELRQEITALKGTVSRIEKMVEA